MTDEERFITEKHRAAFMAAALENFPPQNQKNS
jgi:hypothetical protein